MAYAKDRFFKGDATIEHYGSYLPAHEEIMHYYGLKG